MAEVTPPNPLPPSPLPSPPLPSPPLPPAQTTACGAPFRARTTPQPSQNPAVVEPSYIPGPTGSLSGLRPQSFQLLGEKKTKKTKICECWASIKLLRRKSVMTRALLRGKPLAVEIRPGLNKGTSHQTAHVPSALRICGSRVCRIPGLKTIPKGTCGLVFFEGTRSVVLKGSQKKTNHFGGGSKSYFETNPFGHGSKSRTPSEHPNPH